MASCSATAAKMSTIVVFLAIHPFQDGNGQLSRILTTLLLLKAGYAYMPFSSLESVIEQHKESYYLALRRTQSTLQQKSPDWEPWVGFFLRALQRQKRRLSEKVDQGRLMLSTMSELAEKIVELARAHGRISVADIVRATGANRSTVKSRLSVLVRDGVLSRHGQGRTTWYVMA